MNKVFLGDCRDVMRALIRQGVTAQMCVTSPPYWGLRDYGVAGQLGREPTLGEYIANMAGVFSLVREMLTDDGTLWLNLGDAYASVASGAQGKHGQRATRRFTASTVAKRDAALKPKDLCGIPWRVAFALQEAGWHLRQDIIWHKPNPMPESVTDRCTKAHEYLFLLAKSERYYFDQEAIKEPVNGGAHARAPGNHSHKATTAYLNGAEAHRTKAGLVAYAKKFRAPPGVNPKARKSADWRNKQNESFSASVVGVVEQRNKRSVWTVASEPFADAHFATYPQKLIEPCILAGSRAGDIVLDPFFGSGTTGQVAQALGRQWIGIELNPAYGAMQQRRTRQSALAL